ncbi:electron transport complex subunit RsxC [Thalassotalea sp. PLHSN55]|uniref:electron transport complex subunit RsxC n=1 Tax=Thalassotalea sp. PLHSN55 TaxID=3435888 RepID=UPI003F84FBCD
MEQIIERIKRGHFWKFHGGIHPPEQKFLTNAKPIRTLTMPKQLILPLQQHIGHAGKLIVNEGDTVLKGQALTCAKSPMSVPIHAPTSGVISAIKPAIIAHPSGMQEPCIFLTPDGEDTWQPRTVCQDFHQLENSQLIEKIANAGISGMGGAGFPTHIKVNSAHPIKYLIINAAECEPYITADDLLMREHSPSIVDGIKIIDKLVQAEFIFIGIEDNKPEAIKALQQATQDIDKITVCVLPTKYPTGGEKQLIKILTGQEVPTGVLPSKLGIVMQNVATCYAIADAVINDTPLLKRVVTVTGQALAKPQNVWALLGTPIEHLLTQCGYNSNNSQQLIMGGPMMGYTLPSTQVPVVKTTNCILVPSKVEIPTTQHEVECIRCGQCAEVCPSTLLPQELQWSAKAKDQQQLNRLNLFDCIECGACAYVCPSQIPLVHYYRIAKAEIREQQQADIKAEQAKNRFEARKLRLEKEKRAREEKHRKAAEARKARMNSGTAEANKEKSAVAAALARVKAKKQQTVGEDAVNNAASPEKSQVSAAIARAKAKKLAAQKLKDNASPTSDEETAIESSATSTAKTSAADEKKAKVAATIAKAKAKKLAEKAAAQSSENTVSDKEAALSPADAKKAKIAATIAKAKAKKLAAKTAAQSSEAQSSETKSSEAQSSEVKSGETQSHAKDTAAESSGNTASEKETELSPADAKKAKIAAAIAKAKAKKLAAQNRVEETSTEHVPQPSIDTDKKQRIADAVAKAKAKKQQRESI